MADLRVEHPEWTAEPPSEPGLYWFAPLDSKGVRRHCEVHEVDGRMCVYPDGGAIPLAFMRGVWAGPLREPTGEATHDG